MRRPFFSVVIDNHNYGRFLRQAIDSVLAQDFPASDFELLVVDDGSTDDSRAIIASYKDEVRGVLQERQGQATAFNRGFSEAKGEVVCLLDSDDYWMPDKLSSCAKPFADPKVGVTQHFLRDESADGPLAQAFPDWPARYAIADFLDGRTHFTATSGLCIRRKLLTEIPKDLFYYLDDYLFVHALLEADAANVPRVLGVHRIHGANWCAGGIADARKLALDFEMRRIYGAALDGWLAERGLSRTANFVRLQALEDWRRRVLLAALSGKPGEAWDEWVAGLGQEGGGFRAATLFLAVLSPALYLACYSLYSSARSLKPV